MNNPVTQMCKDLQTRQLHEDEFCTGVHKIVEGGAEDTKSMTPLDIIDEKLALHRVRTHIILKVGLEDGGNVVEAVDARLRQLTDKVGKHHRLFRDTGE